jgi:3-oxo-4-pregnene-20-carboxyl-CoA dehydrogenase alpha subunit
VDFAAGEAQLAVAELAATLLGAASQPDQAAGQGSSPSDDGYDTATWKELAGAGLLSLTLPASLGGDGLGLLDTAPLLTEAGRQAARVPALATLALGVLPVVRHGSVTAQERMLAGVPAGETVLTAAVREPSDPMPALPRASASADASAVTGVKVGVPYAAAARWLVVPVSLATGQPALVTVAADAPGLELQRTHSSSGVPEYTVRFEQAPVAYRLGESAGAVADLYQLAIAGACCVADGALAASLALTTEHVRTRKQFGKPLATFQAVAQQIADVYIVARTFHLATLSACWRLSSGRDASEDLDVAAYWLASQLPAAMRSCHHLHGGLGMDVSYPLHKYSALVTDLVRLVGGEQYRLDQLAARQAG